jgi:Holliday junction resolvase RusA-like endonuclease
MIAFIIPGKPIPKARPRMTKYGHVYTSKTTQDYEKSIIQYFSITGQKKINGALYMRLYVYIEMPMSWSKKKKEEMKGKPHTSKPDLDNILKSVADGLNGLAYDDDSQLAMIYTEKKWNDMSFVKVEIEELK